MKPNSVIIFFGRKYELCKAFGLFGKENLIFESKFDQREYESSHYVKYYFAELNADIIFLENPTSIYDLKSKCNLDIIYKCISARYFYIFQKHEKISLLRKLYEFSIFNIQALTVISNNKSF